jgi:hypothetical protein
MQQSESILKLLLKNPDKELQSEWAECITSLVKDYPSNFIQWGQVWPELALAAIRELETGTTHSIMLQLIKSRLAEAKQ